MSHAAEGDFCITNIEALQQAVATQCPTLEMVKCKQYRTWADDHSGRFVGDYPLPAVYQIRLFREWVRAAGSLATVKAACETVGVKLPTNLDALEDTPLTLKQLTDLKNVPEYVAAYKVVTAQIGHDAEYVIRAKDPSKQKRYYGIGIVPNPVREGEWDMITDFYAQGNGLLTEPGVGRHQRDTETGDVWAGTLKQAYHDTLVTSMISLQQAIGNSAYSQVHREVLADGTIKITTTGY